MPKVPYPYEVNGKLVTGNGSLITICSLSNPPLLPSMTVVVVVVDGQNSSRTKGRSILFNHFIDMRTSVNLSISCL